MPTAQIGDNCEKWKMAITLMADFHATLQGDVVHERVDADDDVGFVLLDTASYLGFFGGHFEMYLEDGFEDLVVGDFVD